MGQADAVYAATNLRPELEQLEAMGVATGGIGELAVAEPDAAQGSTRT